MRLLSMICGMGRFNRTVAAVLLAATAILMSPTKTAEAATLLEVQQLTADSVYHFVYSVPVGPGPYDVIRVHRVVKVEPGDNGAEAAIEDIEAEDAVFMIHGSGGLFEGNFLAGEYPSAESDDQSPAVVLARRNIDVWGIDLAWSLVPFGTQDFAFMADWGMQRQVDEVLAGLDVARDIRGKGMGIRGQLHLLGYSLGGPIGYAVLNADVGSACSTRRVKGYISMENGFALSDPAVVQRGCAEAAERDLQIADGIYQFTQNLAGSAIGTLAQVNPAGPSPFAPGLTNAQLALVVLALPGGGPPPVAIRPSYHFFAGVFDPATGLPVDLVHVTPALGFEFLQGLSGFPPLRLLSDLAHGFCGDIDVAYDDHLGQVTVPALYVGADGGHGAIGESGIMQLGSTDVSVQIVDLAPPGQELFDYGHVDLAFGRDAAVLAWHSIADWIRDHDDSVCK